jgi:hypothetical protein
MELEVQTASQSHTAFGSSQKINAAGVQRGQAGHPACIFDLPL